VIILYYINYFFIFSFLGHILESLFFNKSGILLGWWTPIYGIGCVLILIIHKFIDKLKVKNFTKGLLLFFMCLIILTIIEAIAGYSIEFIFNITFWDYSNYKFNIGKYIALESSLIWGIGSIILIYLIKPFLDKIIGKIPKYLTYLLIILFMLDIFLTMIVKH